jgi:hypothetical protein
MMVECLFFREGHDPLYYCIDRLISLIESLPASLELNREVEINMEYYSRQVEFALKQLLITDQAGSSLKGTVENMFFEYQ